MVLQKVPKTFGERIGSPSTAPLPVFVPMLDYKRRPGGSQRESGQDIPLLDEDPREGWLRAPNLMKLVRDRERERVCGGQDTARVQ